MVDSSEAIEINSSGGDIKIGSDDVDQNISIGAQGERTISIGTGAFAGTVNVGNGTGASTVDIKAGTAGVTIGTNAVAHTIQIGNSTGATSLDFDAGTGGANITSAGTLQLTSSKASQDGAVAILATGGGSSLVLESGAGMEFGLGTSNGGEGSTLFLIASGTTDEGPMLFSVEAQKTAGHGIVIFGKYDDEGVLAADGGGRDGSLLVGSSSMQGYSNVFASGENGPLVRTGGEYGSQILGLSGSKMRFADDYSFGSNLTKEFVQLADSTAEYNSFVSNFSATKSIIGAINSCASSIGAAAKTSGSITGQVAAGAAVANSNVGMTTVDLSSLNDSGISKQVDLFVNGQLLMSGTEVQRAAGTADYLWSTVGASADFKLSFALDTDDVIQVTIR